MVWLDRLICMSPTSCSVCVTDTFALQSLPLATKEHVGMLWFLANFK